MKKMFSVLVVCIALSCLPGVSYGADVTQITNSDEISQVQDFDVTVDTVFAYEASFEYDGGDIGKDYHPSYATTTLREGIEHEGNTNDSYLNCTNSHKDTPLNSLKPDKSEGYSSYHIEKLLENVSTVSQYQLE